MKHISPLFIIGAIASVGLLSIATTDAAVIIEPNGKLLANFSAGTTASNSTLAGVGTLLAPGLTPGAASVFGGEPYTYTYTPSTDLDNTVFSVGGTLNSNAGLFASGLTGGAAGFYNIYHAFPETTNAGGQPTLYDVQVNGSSSGVTMFLSSQDQNVSDNTTGQSDGVGIGLWELIGQATVLNASDTITMTVDKTSGPSFVGSRTAGVLIEYAGVIPEPSRALLSLLGVGAVLVRRRR